MRRCLFFSALLLAAVGLVLVGDPLDSGSAVAEALQGPQVNITVSCDGENAVDDVNVRPWTARARRGNADQLRWRLQPNSGVTSATIRPKATSSWPFASTPPLTVNIGETVESGSITGADGSYFYDIVVDCGSGPTVIDPRMDIRP